MGHGPMGSASPQALGTNPNPNHSRDGGRATAQGAWCVFKAMDGAPITALFPALYTKKQWTFDG
eukprot:scaffold191037_cov31-Tisochrysis_lutea.AAC.1